MLSLVVNRKVGFRADSSAVLFVCIWREGGGRRKYEDSVMMMES